MEATQLAQTSARAIKAHQQAVTNHQSIQGILEHIGYDAYQKAQHTAYPRTATSGDYEATQERHKQAMELDRQRAMSRANRPKPTWLQKILGTGPKYID
jgi:hypothetical protein